MATTRHRFLVSFTRDELRDHVEPLCRQVRLTRSELVRRLVLGQRLPDANEFKGAEAIGDLLKINADAARLGNLLKLTLDEADGQFSPPTIARIEDLLSESRNVQTAIRAKVEDLHFEIHPRRKRRS